MTPPPWPSPHHSHLVPAISLILKQIPLHVCAKQGEFRADCVGWKTKKKSQLWNTKTFQPTEDFKLLIFLNAAVQNKICHTVFYEQEPSSNGQPE